MTVLQIRRYPGILMKSERKARIAVIHIQIQAFLRHLMIVDIVKQTVCSNKIIFLYVTA